MSSDKIIVTTCVALWGGYVSAVVYDMMSGWSNNKKNNKTTQDGEISVIEPSSCGCPFASVHGVALTGGVLSGALTWVYYKN